jgi:hypothetical protein
MAPINGGNEGEIDAAFFFSSGGSVGATGEAVRGRLAAAPCTPGVGAGGGRRRAVGWAGRKAKAGGEGEQAGWAEKGCRAARSAGPKAKKGNKRISELKFDF